MSNPDDWNDDIDDRFTNRQWEKLIRFTQEVRQKAEEHPDVTNSEEADSAAIGFLRYLIGMALFPLLALLPKKGEDDD